MIVKETFLTYQGTGFLSGVLQYFIRVAGCSQPCPLRTVCDEPGSLSPSGAVIEESDLLDLAARKGGSGCEWIHITGGEPLEQPESIKKMTQMGGRWMFQLQTSGLLPVGDSGVGFITVSPKRPASRLRQVCGDELVVVNDPRWITDEVVDEFSSLAFSHFFIIPLEKSGRFNFGETAALARRHGSKWRIGSQMHKFWGMK